MPDTAPPAPSSDGSGPEPGRVELPCPDPAATADFLTAELDFVVDSVMPADAPEIVEVTGRGLRLRLVRGTHAAHGIALRLPGVDRERVAPGGLRVLPSAATGSTLPPLRASFGLARLAEATWRHGRAGMEYRDLIPDRLGGRFVASHIRIPAGGRVPDYVHHHDVAFQVLYCWRGEVRVVYEDQGPPRWMRAGDCIVQPPHIRHRVLECSPGFEVVGVASPATHPTIADHAMILPTTALRPDRAFGGQRFAHHVAAAATWLDRPNGSVRDLGVADATGGAATARVVRGVATCPGESSELRMTFVLGGAVTLHREGEAGTDLGAGDCVVIPAGTAHRFETNGAAPELLQITAPAT